MLKQVSELSQDVPILPSPAGVTHHDQPCSNISPWPGQEKMHRSHSVGMAQEMRHSALLCPLYSENRARSSGVHPTRSEQGFLRNAPNGSLRLHLYIRVPRDTGPQGWPDDPPGCAQYVPFVVVVIGHMLPRVRFVAAPTCPVQGFLGAPFVRQAFGDAKRIVIALRLLPLDCAHAVKITRACGNHLAGLAPLSGYRVESAPSSALCSLRCTAHEYPLRQVSIPACKRFGGQMRYDPF